jgi:hydrogenase nickel incorporation protein HypA/HybF
VHELSITQAIVDSVVERMGDTPIARITVHIGRLSGVAVDSVRFCFDLVADGTPVAGAELVVIEQSGHARCLDCASEFDVDDPILLCPGCDSARVDVLSGRELLIRSVEVRSECAPRAAAATTPTSG